MDNMITVASAAGYSAVSLNGELTRRRVVNLEGEVNHEMAMMLARTVMFMALEDPKKPIHVVLNSPGGEIKAGMIIHDVLQSVETPIYVYAIGRAYSMGAVILACGSAGRYLLPSSEVMLHQPLLTHVEGNATKIKAISDNLQETKERMNALLARHTGKTVEEIEEICREDHYFSADEAVAFGLADEVVTFDEMVRRMRA